MTNKLSLAEQNATVARVSEVSLRMMAGTVTGSTLASVQHRVQQSPDVYPWEDVVQEVLAEPADASALVNKGLQAQRDWVLRGGAEVVVHKRPKKSLSHHGKTFAAKLLVRSIFFVVYTFAIIVLLVLLKHQFEWFDIYRLLDWGREALPSLFRKN